VQYKNIPSALHNYAHSFMSLMNYREGEYVVDVVSEVLRELPQYELHVSFIDGKLAPDRIYPAVLLASAADYSLRFAGHLASHNVDHTAVVEATLVLRGTGMGITSRVRAKDNRGQEYDVPVAA